METYNLASITKKIYDSSFQFFTQKTLKEITGIKKENSFFSVLKKLIRNGVLVKIERGKYILEKRQIDDFSLANFLYQSSYVSFESALNFHGILSQFPYEITSATTRKSLTKSFEGKTFSYVHLDKKFFTGYEKKNGMLIAEPEKALADQQYLKSKGRKTINFDELDLKQINITKFNQYLKLYDLT